jgi:hypothetical protein
VIVVPEKLCYLSLQTFIIQQPTRGVSMMFKGSVTALLLFGLAIAGCKKDEGPTNNGQTPTTTTYVGTIASGTESGSITVAVSLGKSNGISGGVSGTLKLVRPSAATISLSGTFSNNALSVSGGGYTFAGTLTGGTIAGSYAGPNGIGTFTTQSSTNNSAQVYAGTFTSTVAGQPSGTFNLVINGTVITGLAITSDNQTTVYLAGTLSGTTITIRDASSNTGIATGTLSGTTVSGSFDAGSNRGTWSGTLVQ